LLYASNRKLLADWKLREIHFPNKVIKLISTLNQVKGSLTSGFTIIINASPPNISLEPFKLEGQITVLIRQI